MFYLLFPAGNEAQREEPRSTAIGTPPISNSYDFLVRHPKKYIYKWRHSWAPQMCPFKVVSAGTWETVLVHSCAARLGGTDLPLSSRWAPVGCPPREGEHVRLWRGRSRWPGSCDRHVSFLTLVKATASTNAGVCLSRVESTLGSRRRRSASFFLFTGRVQRRKRQQKNAGERWRTTGVLPEQERQCRSKCHVKCVWQRVTRRVAPVGQVGPSVKQVLLSVVFFFFLNRSACGTLTSLVAQCEVSPPRCVLCSQ